MPDRWFDMGKAQGMTALGKIIEVWRYPVSSVGGERLDRAAISAKGVSGDRSFALFEAETGLAAAPEKDTRWRPALFLNARYGGEGLPSLEFPDGQDVRLDDHTMPSRLRAHFGFEVMVGTYAGADESFDSRLPVVSARYEPSCLHILTTASMRRLGVLSSVASICARRFRPTLVVDTGETDGFVENHWVGRRLKIGEVKVSVIEATRRCGVTLSAQPDLPEEPAILRTIMRQNGRRLGVYASVGEPAWIAKGDLVYAGI